MEKNEDGRRCGARRAGAVWAALALSAGLAAAPAAALAEEAGGAADADVGDAAAAAQGGQAQAQPQAGGQQAGAGDAGQQAAGGSAQTAAQAKAPAASSDRGTYEKAGLHRVTVTYVDADGRQIAPAHREALADGESYGVRSPAVGGYELADASQATVSGTVAKGSGDVSVAVRYRSTLVTYTVVHERQVGPRSSEYRVSETETLKAPSGTRVTAAPRSYDNYDCVTDVAHRTAEVTPDGKATIVIRYDVIVPTYGVYFSTRGSYVAPQTGAVGDRVTAPANPTRAGYSFAGWDTDGDGSADVLPTTIPDHDVTATAVWKPETATYLVKYWGEDKGDDSDTFKYHLLRTDALTGTTDSAVPEAARLDTAKGGEYQWYQYAREDQGVKIAGDSTTVLNVYYDWKKVKVYYRAQLDSAGDFSKCPDVTSPVMKKMNDFIGLPTADAALKIYRANGGKLEQFAKWRDVVSGLTPTNSNTIQTNSVVWLSDESLESYYLATFTNYNMNAHYCADYTQNPDGKTYTTSAYDLRKTQSSQTHWVVKQYPHPGIKFVAWRTSTNVWDGKDVNDIIWGNWHKVSEGEVDSSGHIRTGSITLSQANVFQLKFDRIPYDVTYYSQGEAVGTKAQLFGSTIDVSTPAGLTAPDGMAFAGWYANPDFSGDPVTSLTMPEGGVHLYALWKRPDVHVTFDPAGGTPVAAQTVEWGQKATRPADPVRAGYEFGGWYYFGGPGAAAKPRLLRAVAASGTPAPFPFDLELQADAHLVAAWRSANVPTTYTVRHVLADGTVLYEETHQGTVGQTVSALALPKGDARRRGHAYASASGATIDLSADASRNVVTFTYSDDATHPYVVHLWDAETGLPIAADIDFDSVEALMDYLAPRVAGYHVLFGGRGYLSDREGGQELTFWYERDSEPAQPARAATPRVVAVPAAKSAPCHMAKSVPATGDPASPVLPAGLAFLGSAMAAAGARLRRRDER